MSIDITPTTILAPFEAEHQAVNLTRDTKGSAWNKIGNNKLIDTDQWRYNYNPDTGIFEGRTIMGQWTNEILDPRDMTTGNWTKSGVTVARNAIGIDGESNTGNTVTSTGSGSDNISQDVTIPNDSNTHTIPVYIAKSSVSDNVAVRVTLLGGTNVEEFSGGFDPETDTSSAVNGSITDKGDYIRYDMSITNNSSGNTTARVQFYPDRDTTSRSAIIGLEGLFLNRSTPPPTPVYGETAGQSYTQDPDIATVTDLDAINFNPSEGTFVVEGRLNSLTGIPRFFDVSDGTDNTKIDLFYQEAQNALRFSVANNGSFNTIDINNFTNTDFVRIACSYNSDGTTKLSLNGNTTITETSPFPQGLSQLAIGHRLNDFYMDGFQRSLKYYPRQLTDAQHQQESTL